jgi:hypothetical protein
MNSFDWKFPKNIKNRIYNTYRDLHTRIILNDIKNYSW